MSESLYLAIKRSITDGIASGRYAPGELLPSEHELCRAFNVARMTVNRAMRELAAEQIVRRVPGVGTFVADKPAHSGLMDIRDIAEEIAARFHTHRAQLFELTAVAAEPAAAEEFGLPAGSTLFHSAVLHFEDSLPLQYEERLVDPALAPNYLAQDFTRITPAAYLNAVAPLQEGEHVVQAIVPDAPLERNLALAPGEACLVITRRTWSAARLVAITTLYYPGNRFRLMGRFVPEEERLGGACRPPHVQSTPSRDTPRRELAPRVVTAVNPIIDGGSGGGGTPHPALFSVPKVGPND